MPSRFAIVLIAAVMPLGGCATACYSAMESVGFAKREILTSRVVAGLEGKVDKMDAQVSQLVAELDNAIAEANRFIFDFEKSAD